MEDICSPRGGRYPALQRGEAEKLCSELTSADFARFFQELWGYTPFTWQRKLAERVVDGDESSCWPEAISLSTAAGKTACIDIAIFALAAQAQRLGSAMPIAAPRRIFFVVDRRIIVDQAHARAQKISCRLQLAKGGIIKDVADRLRQIAHGATSGWEDARPLAVHVLRGGMYRSESWARDPLQPTIVASTVDQIGSRLLFRAYGRSSGTWPIFAGLISNDSLVFLDEAHCARPFLQTLQAVNKFRTWASQPLGRAFHPVIMSATPPAHLSDVFEDNSEERRDPDHILGKRMLVHKFAALEIVPVEKSSGAVSRLSESLAGAVENLLNGEPRAIVVFVNRVATARETYRRLQKKQMAEVVLLTGRMRQIDKGFVTDRLKFLELGSSRNHERPIVVVATQTLEVGADLDFDDLVTECASLDALRQRFGRLNRAGRPIQSRAVILGRSDQIKEDAEEDPVYGRTLGATWRWLNQIKDEQAMVDFGVAYMDENMSRTNSVDELATPTLDAPVMLPAHIDCWAQTGPNPLYSPDTAPFLRGPQRGAADVQVCWRADLVLDDVESRDSLVRMKICPPSSVETLAVPVGVLKAWLSKKKVRDDSPDVEGAVDMPNDRDPKNGPKVLRWHGRKTSRKDIVSDMSLIEPGDVVVIPSGHPASPESIGDFPSGKGESEVGFDVGDRSHLIARSKYILRLHPNLVKLWPEEISSERSEVLDLLNTAREKYEEDSDEFGDTIGSLLEKIAAKNVPSIWSWLPSVAKGLLSEYRGNRIRRAYQIIGNSVVISGRMRHGTLHTVEVFSDEDDSDSSGTSYQNGRPVGLKSHLEGVRAFARRYALGCGLEQDLVQAIECAGLFHDLGKADPRFQSMLNGGILQRGELLAKSASMPRGREYDRVRRASGYPDGGRHELLSTRLVEGVSRMTPHNAPLRDLVLHLIASHHGYCRPFAPVISDETQTRTEIELYGDRFRWSGPTNLERLDSGVSDRFWRLTRRYGWWGLAWLESMLRLADWMCSEHEEVQDGKT